MNINLAKVLSVFMIIISVGVSDAYADESVPNSVNKYGSAGCGLGAKMIGDEPGAIQIIASTFNMLLFNQIFAISSGTSGCQFGRLEAMSFIDVNRVALTKDIVHGQGETLDNFAKLLGCPSDLLAPELKKNYDRVFEGGKNAIESGNAVFELIQTQPKLHACAAVG